jgi:hypothetical protein
MNLTETNRAREMALATALRIDDMIRKGIETRDNLVALFGLDGQIPSPAGEQAACEVILPPTPPVSREGAKGAKGNSPQATLDAIKQRIPSPAGQDPETHLETLPTVPPAKPKRVRGNDAALLSKLGKTFTVAKLQELSGLSDKGAYSAVYRMRAKGMVENIGDGVWVTTAGKA